jgi:hypothetical protein
MWRTLLRGWKAQRNDIALIQAAMSSGWTSD